MISLIKFLKIVLPAATVTTATIATVSLVSFKKIDLDQNRDNEDRVLDDFELKAKDFKEKKMLYSKDGKNDSVTLEDDTLAEEILKKFQNGEDLGEFEGKVPDIEKIKKFLSESKDTLGNKPSEVNSERNNGDAGLPDQSSSPQDALSKPVSDGESGMQGDQINQDDSDASAISSDPKMDNGEDQGNNDSPIKQKAQGDSKEHTLTNKQDALPLTEDNQIQAEEVDKGKTDVDSELQETSISKSPQDTVLENGLNQEADTQELTEELGSKSGAPQQQTEAVDGLTDPEKQTPNLEQSGPEIKQSFESNGVGDGNNIYEGASSEGKKELSAKEIQELEDLEKEMEALKDSLKILSL